MARYFLLFFVFILGSAAVTAQTSTLEGKVTDASTKEDLIGVNVVLYKPGSETEITGTNTDINGNYSLASVSPGTYDVEFTYVGYSPQRQAKVVLYGGQVVNLNIQMTDGLITDELVITEYIVPLIDHDNTTSSSTITSEDIKNLPSKNISGIIAATAGASATDDGGAVSIRGSRENSNIVYIDGVRVRGNSNIPTTEAEQIQVMTGGISAAYGDVTGGVTSITTKGPSEKFSAYAEIENSKYLDDYGYLLANIGLSGPIWKKLNPNTKKKETVVGYRLAFQYWDRADRSPTATGVYKLKDDVHADMMANPVIPSDNGTKGLRKALFLTEDDVELVSARPNSGLRRFDVNGKVDIRINKAIDMSFGGSAIYQDGRGTTNSLMNYHNASASTSLEYRGYGRFRHRISNPNDTTSVIRNLGYTLQFSYERRTNERQSAQHEDRFFDYGYVGKFDYTENPLLQADVNIDTNGVVTIERTHSGYGRIVTGFTPGEINSGLGAYNEGISEYSTLEDFNVFNGRVLNGTNGLLGNVYGLHGNINEVYNTYSKNDNHQYQFNVTGSFEFLPGGSEKGRHSIEFGLLYEQRESRSWALNPVGLWQAGRQLLNSHFDGVDTNFVVGYQITQTITGLDSVALHPYLAKDAQWATGGEDREDQQTYFDKSVRTALGVGRNDYIFIDELSPDQLSLDMFSADELVDNFGGIGYFGYDYLGNPLGGTTSFNDFFTQKDNDGNFTRPVAPNTPIYTAAYIQDKFRYKDIIFRVGLRIDRYDSNTKVLRDDYSLFETYGAADYSSKYNVTNPSNIGDNFVVYEANPGSGAITAYRDGEQWYTSGGEPVNSPTLIFGGAQAKPALVDASVDDPRDLNYNFEAAFEDATPQVVLMPRLAFSFPINENAGFFAHYDILTQRPPSNTLATPLSFYRFYSTVQNNGNLNNPSLRPERTVDYEVGFRQKLTEKSALEISLYYKELRDMIQSQYYAFAYPLSYFGYGNQDYGTVKGITFEYDLRRMGNVQLVANYTLQFAEGTGSNVGSQRGFANRGNLRSIFPMSFDERHRFTLRFDYRYGKGQRYNGPVINDVQVLSNAGLSILGLAASGRPYTRSQIITGPFDTDGVVGGYNAARLPWNTRFDARIYKDFVFNMGKSADGQDAKSLKVNIYCRVQNLFDTRNLLGVYDYSQSPDDTGYLNSAIGSNAISQQSVDAQGYYITSYQWAMLNPGFYTQPRRIFVGAVFEL